MSDVPDHLLTGVDSSTESFLNSFFRLELPDNLHDLPGPGSISQDDLPPLAVLQRFVIHAEVGRALRLRYRKRAIGKLFGTFRGSGEGEKLVLERVWRTTQSRTSGSHSGGSCDVLVTGGQEHLQCVEQVDSATSLYFASQGWERIHRALDEGDGLTVRQVGLLVKEQRGEARNVRGSHGSSRELPVSVIRIRAHDV